MRLVQLRDGDGRRAVAASHGKPGQDGEGYRLLADVETVYELALESIESGRSLAATASTYVSATSLDLGAALAEGRVLPPLDHPVPTRCWVTGAAADGASEASWFFRGNGSTVVAAGHALTVPAFARGVNLPLPALAALYVIAEDGTPCRVGFALAHALTEPSLGGGHAQLRPTAVGPELVLGTLPAELTAEARLVREGQDLARGSVALAPAALAPLTEAHFRYDVHRRPGDVHVHLYVAAFTPPQTQPDLARLAAAGFGHALENAIARASTTAPAVREL